MIKIFSGDQAVMLANAVSPYGGNFLEKDTIVAIYERNNEVKCAVILNHWERNSVEATAISTGSYVSPLFIKSVYDLVFLKEERDVLLMWTEVDNDLMNKIHQKFGHRVSGLCQDKFGRGRDGVLWTITKHQWEENSNFA